MDESMNTFLNKVGKTLNETRIVLPKTIDHIVEYRKRDKSYAAIWFKTKGCRYSFEGGCTMCDYFIGNDVSGDEMYQSFLTGMDELPEQPDLMVIQTSGSFFDPNEVPEYVRIRIFELLKERLTKTILVFETHITTITEKVAEQLLSYFTTERVQIEFGVETSNEWIRKYCVNKWITNDQIEKSIQILRRFQIAALANIVIGIPFLSLKENVESASNSITWAIQHGITSICLFPVNLKPYTLTNWLNQHALYQQPSLWALIDVIINVRKFFLPRVDTNWYRKTAKMDNPLYDASIQGPDTCEKCNEDIIKLLDKYNLDNTERVEAVKNLELYTCSCRNRYRDQLQTEHELSLHKRVKQYYSFIGKKLYGESFWNDETRKYLDI